MRVEWCCEVVGSCEVQVSCEVRCSTSSQPDKHLYVCVCVTVCVFLFVVYYMECESCVGCESYLRPS